jgi:hypothetical protein
MQCRPSPYVELSLSGLPTGKRKCLRRNRCGTEICVQISGEPRYHKVVGKAGKAIERGFCPNCGSQVTVKLERLPDILGLQAASLADPSIYRPAIDVFTSSAQPWDHMNPAVQKHTHAPPM